MIESFMQNIDMVKFLWASIAIPVLGYIGFFIKSTIKSKRRKKRLIEFLNGLPVEHKAVLIDFYKEGAHTLARDHWFPPVEFLVGKGVLILGCSARGYRAYITVRPDVWEVMDAWIIQDIAALELLTGPV